MDRLSFPDIFPTGNIFHNMTEDFEIDESARTQDDQQYNSETLK